MTHKRHSWHIGTVAALGGEAMQDNDQGVRMSSVLYPELFGCLHIQLLMFAEALWGCEVLILHARWW